MYRRQHYTDIVLQIHGRYESRKILRYWGSHDPEMQYFRNIQTVSQRSMCGTHLEQTSGVRQGKRMWLTPASLLMAIQISRVIERSSIWMPSARDVTRNRAITLPFLDASLALSSWPLSRFVSSSVSTFFIPPSLNFADKFVVFLFPVNESIGSTLRPRRISARRVARAPNGRTLESAYHPETYAERETDREAQDRERKRRETFN